MAAIIVTSPPVVSLSQEPMPVEIGTNLVSPHRAYFNLIVFGFGPQNDETILLLWLDKRVIITARNTPDNSGLQIPTPDAANGVDAAYTEALAEALRRNEILSDDWTIIGQYTATGEATIVFTSRYQTAVSPFANNLLSDVTFDPYPQGAAYLKPNLTALVRVEKTSGEVLLKVSPSYTVVENGGLYAGRATTDIRSAFELYPHLPDFSALMGVASRSFATYKIRYADKYGSPPVAESLLPSPTHHVIFGGRAANSPHIFAPNAKGYYVCHPSQARLVTRQQKAWTYIFSPEEKEITVGVRVLLKNDPRQDLVYWAGDKFTIAANKLYYFASGYVELGIQNYATAVGIDPNNIIGYDFLLILTTMSMTLVSVPFSFDSCHFDSLTLAYSNGLGGIDTVNMRGGYAQKSEVERALIRHFYADETDTTTGEFSTIEAEGQGIIEVETGYYPPQYAAQLRQLLMGQVRLVDTKNARFIKLIADSKSVEFKPKKRGLVSFQMVFKEAFISKNFV